MNELNFISRNKFKFIARLKEKKHRDNEGLFLAEGLIVVQELINSKFFIDNIFVTEQFIKSNPDFISNNAKRYPRQYSYISEKDLNALTGAVTPQGIIAVARKMSWSEEFEQGDLNNIVYLDTISDPGNLAAVIRTAAWFGLDGIIISQGSVDLYSPKVIRGSVGSVFNVPTITDFNFADQFDNYKSFSWIGADANGQNIITDFSKPKKVIICFGNESRGLSENVRKKLVDTVRIPSVNAKIESLNLAIASSIILYEIMKENAQ